MLEEILWNDPRQIDENKEQERSRRGLGRYFGTSVTRTWLQATDTKAVIRGHEPCLGFRLDHDNMIMTLFSCKDITLISSGYLMLMQTATLNRRSRTQLSLHVKSQCSLDFFTSLPSETVDISAT